MATINDLTTATTDLLAAVTTGKSALDQAVADAEVAAALAAADRAQTGTDRAAATLSAEEAEAAKDEAVAAWTAAVAADQTLEAVIRMNPQTLHSSAVIPSWYNAYSAGPIWVGDEAEVTVSDNATWNVL